MAEWRSNLEAALWYAERGIPVFPLAPRSKAPLTRHGYRDATTDVDQIRQWWSERPEAGIGIPTGLVSGYVVLDIDPRNGGDQSLVELIRDVKISIDAPTVHTGGGGLHFYFRHSGNEAVKCCNNLGDYKGIDLKADGGYVVAPPSIHPTGAAYRWDEEKHLE